MIELGRALVNNPGVIPVTCSCFIELANRQSFQDTFVNDL